MKKHWQIIALTFGLTLLVVACESRTASTSSGIPTGTSTPVNNTLTSDNPSAAPTRDKWAELLLRTPFPFTMPLPPPIPSVLDGIYAKFEPREETPVPCRRCPDYAPFLGVWRLQLDKGIFRVYYEFWKWTSMGSYTLSGDQITFFNDPNCIDDVGVYAWKLEQGQLTLKEMKDDCAIRMRATNFANRPWLLCQPPNIEAAITDHWQKPSVCR